MKAQKPLLPSIYEALDYDSASAEESLQILQKIRRTYAKQIEADENARELYLADLGHLYLELGEWQKAYKVTSQRLKIVRPAVRTSSAYALLVAAHLLAARHAARPKPYLCEVLDEIRFVEDIGVEPAAVIALQQMIKLPDYKLCGKALYIFKKVTRRFEMPDLEFNSASVEKLYQAYSNKYLKARI